MNSPCGFVQIGADGWTLLTKNKTVEKREMLNEKAGVTNYIHACSTLCGWDCGQTGHQPG